MPEQAFDPHFQKAFITHFLRDSEFLSHVKSDVTPDLFTNEYDQKLVRLVKDFGEKEKAAPGPLIFTILNDWKSRNLISDESCKNLTVYINDLLAVPLQNRQFLLKEFDRFARFQVFKKNILPAAKHIELGQFKEAEELLRQTFLYRQSRSQNMGRAYTDNVLERIQRRQNKDTEQFWTFIPELDSRVDGIKRGELGVLQSQRSSDGKSAALGQFARAFAFQGYNVLIISLEMSEEDYEDRLDMTIAGVTTQGLVDGDLIRKRIEWMHKVGGGRIRIKQLPGRITTVDDLRNFTQLLESTENFTPDVIVLDYIDELKGPGKGENSYTAGYEVASALRGWAVEDQIAIWTATQSNRQGMEAPVADMEHMGLSMAKVFVADVIISINHTPVQKANNQCSLYVVKNRHGTARITITIDQDFSRMQFYVRSQ